ncbi:unnamed protein product [Miscanthus lutarioriparius]|uniref:Uncharacterized protein n=1 Tax=Miscanthus lutarioriparius TaxID=422564 RepID=A0A811RWK8_9POAL|nr:unnamed protein product [Miscanthus lutarioriparius]
MAPSDRRHARADQADVMESLPSPSQDLTSRDMAPPMPPAPPASASKTEIAVAKRWGATKVADGSVPSPGIGHKAHVKESLPSPASQDVTRDMAPLMPPAPPASASKTEIAVAKRWGTTQADGSVPSPGVGHQQVLQ